MYLRKLKEFLKNKKYSPGDEPGLFCYMDKPVAIQGYPGCFHQQAAQIFFGKQTIVIPCATFREVMQAVKDQDCNGIMAIENSIAGSILPNYTLLNEHRFVITGEVYLQINQHLLANPGVALSDIREVHSHPMALLQCMSFLQQHNWKLVETEDTALSARHIHQHRSRHIAAIAGSLAAELYGLNILQHNIHDLKNNYTRFLVLQRPEHAAPVTGADKASIHFQTDHTRGSLARVLHIIASHGINLSKLQSFPIPGSNFRYRFYADMEFDNPVLLEHVLAKLETATEQLHVFGKYRNGNK